jgi:hypothetical protein
LFIISVVGSIKSFDKFVIFFIRLFITEKDIKPSLLIKRALKRAIKRII